MPNSVKPGDPHSFTVSDEDLFTDKGEFSHKRILDMACYVCGDQPGQGMHVPPPPPQHKVLIETVAQALNGTALGRAVNIEMLTIPAAQLAFTALVNVRAMLHEMSKRPDYDDPNGTSGYVFSNIDTELDDLLTELRKIGWPR